MIQRWFSKGGKLVNMLILRNQKGIASILFLVLLPFFCLATIAFMEHTRSVYGSDLDLQQALNSAVRSAAYSVDELSQAHNDPMVVSETAHLVFRHELASNLGLDSNLAPTEHSGIKNPVNYVLIVYNGDNPYGLKEGVKYSSVNPAGEEFAGSLPCTFTVIETDILVGENDGILTELDEPGCIAVISADFKPLIKGESTGVRWIAAKVVNES